MQLQIASRKNVKIKMGLQGPSGSGKTYGALLMAYGLCGDWSKIAVIDTENHSSELYAHLGQFQVLHLAQPFAPERYMEAIKACENKGVEVVVIDSISHEWNGSGGILEQHGNMAGNSYTNWAKLTPRHNAFIHYFLQNNQHIICTIRAKQDYVLNERNGKMVPEKIGLKGITREGLDYECSLVLELDMRNNAHSSKDRTSLFNNQPEFKITTEVGQSILAWCNTGSTDGFVGNGHGDLNERINNCKSLAELLLLYKQCPDIDALVQKEFTNKKKELEKLAVPQVFLNTHTSKASSNGSLVA